jgi:hypothetical protein
MIGHELHRSGSFWSFLLSIDKDLADSTRRKGCSCGGRLHSANYLLRFLSPLTVPGCRLIEIT